jgi:site-specific DNA-methyltransferase (adenine-specific)
VANTSRKPYLPLNAYIAQQLLDLGLMMRGEIIWDKGPSAGISTAWGSFARASNPILRDVHEYILVFCKKSYKLERTHGKESGIENLEFVEWTKSVWRSPQEQVEDSEKSIWRFDTTSKRRRGKNAPKHPAPFPLDLPLRLILLYTNIGDVILDPFMGSGTTALAAKMTQRHFIGYDISPEYVAEANQRLAALDQPHVIEEHAAPRAAKREIK